MSIFLHFLQIVDKKAFFDIAIMIFTVAAVFPRKYSAGKCFALGLLLSLIFPSINQIFIYLCDLGWYDTTVKFIFFILLLVAVTCIYGLLTANTDWKQCICVILYYMNNLVLAPTITRAIIPNQPDIVPVCIAYVMLIGVTLLYRSITHPITIELSHTYWFLVLITPVIVFIVISLFFYLNETGKLMLILCSGMALLDFIIYLLFVRIVAELTEQMDLRLSNQNLNFQLRQMDSMKEMMENTRKARHEMKNNYFYLESLALEKRSDEIVSYLQDVIGPTFDKDEVISTGNHFVDMVLTQKVQEARVSQIPVFLDVRLPERLAIGQRMLCSLLFNLLDNAIEASRKTDNPDIHFSMYESKGYLYLEVRNAISESVLKKNPNLKTSKAHPHDHGLGMGIIRQIVDHYEGNIDIRESSGQFIITIYLPQIFTDEMKK